MRRTRPPVGSGTPPVRVEACREAVEAELDEVGQGVAVSGDEPVDRRVDGDDLEPANEFVTSIDVVAGHHHERSPRRHGVWLRAEFGRSLSVQVPPRWWCSTQLTAR